MAHRSILLILSTFEGVHVPHKHSSMLQIKEKFSLDFIHALILLLGFFLLLARHSTVCKTKRLHSLLIPLKNEGTSTVNDPCSTWRICWLYSRFFSFSYFLWSAGRLWCKWHLAKELKTLTSQKAVYPLIDNRLADTSALAWWLVFEDFGSFSNVSGVSNGSITTFLQTSSSISAVSFLSSLCLVITSPPFGQDKACCKLNESPQTHSVGKSSREILYLIFIASQRACFSRKKPFLFIGIIVNKIDVPFSVDASTDLHVVLHDILLVTSCGFASFSFFFSIFDVTFYFCGWYVIILKLNSVTHYFIGCFFGFCSIIFIFFLTNFWWND